jgi:hypothetical protein
MTDRLSSPAWQQAIAAATGCVIAVPVLVLAGLLGAALVCMTTAFAVTLALLLSTVRTAEDPGASGNGDKDRPGGGDPEPTPELPDPDAGIDWAAFERDVRAYADGARVLA